MSLCEIEQEIIRPLSRPEKFQLIADITKMLQEEEDAEQAFPRDFRKGNILPVFTPSGMEETAARLQEYIDKGEL